MHENILHKRYSELSKTLQAYQAAVNAAAIVSVTDVAGNILFANHKFLEVSKYSLPELIGKNHRVINSGYHPGEFFKKMWETISSGKYWRGEIKNRAKDGSFYWVDTVITPVLDEKNRVFQYLSVRNLITPQKENEEKLILTQQELLKKTQQLKNAQQVAKTGSWHLDIPGNSLEWSEETYRIFEIPPGTPMTYELFLDKVHPADAHRVNECWQAAMKGAPYEIDHRIVVPGGEKWVSERASLEFDASNSLTAAVGTVQDITDIKKSEDTLRESESLYKSLFNNSPFPNGILDKETLRFLEVNETALRVYGYSREEFLQMTAYDIRVPEEHDLLRELMEKDIFQSDTSIRTHRKKDGRTIRVEPFITEINYKGKPAFLITINDVTEKLKLQEQLIQSKITRQKEISRASIEAQERNRAEIGRELHDNVNQLLVTSNLYLKNVRHASARDKELIEKSIEITVEAIKEIRELSWSLVPPSLNNLTLKETLEKLELNLRLAGTAVELDITDSEDTIPEGLKFNIYRIIQEQVNNIMKYAGASRVKISLTRYPGSLTLEIYDNGQGFDPIQKGKGIGLTNIIYRAEAYNGKVKIDSSPGNGCRISIIFAL